MDDINRAGGVLGQKLVLSVGDDACDPRQAVSVANGFADSGVTFVDGHYCSGSSIPASKVYTDEGILEMTPGSTNPDYTDKGSWNTFRLCGRDDQQGKVAADFIATRFKGDRIALLDDDSAYGKGLADETARNLQADGVTPTLRLTYTPGEQDYSAIVSRMKAAGIQVIYVGGYHTEAGLIIRQAKEQGLAATLIGGDALVTKDFWQVSGPAGEGTLMTFAPDVTKHPEAAAVMREFAARHVDPEGYTLYSYASMQVWAEAAKRAGTTDPRKVAAALKADGPFPSVIGPISFDAKGDVKGPGYVFYVWKNGDYAEL